MSVEEVLAKPFLSLMKKAAHRSPEYVCNHCGRVPYFGNLDQSKAPYCYILQRCGKEIWIKEMWLVQFLSTLRKHLTQWIIQFWVIRWCLRFTWKIERLDSKLPPWSKTICYSKWEKTWPSNSALCCPTGIPLGTKAIFDLRRWLAWLYIKWWIHLYADDTTAFVIERMKMR